MGKPIRKQLSDFCERSLINNPDQQTDLTLRDAAALDEPAIFGLIREGGINPMGIRWDRFVVIEDAQGKIIACGQIKLHRDGTKELASIVVTEKWRSRGLARQIIEHLLERQAGVIYLMCASPLGDFYEKFGFYAIEGNELPRYFRRMKMLVKFPEKLMGFSLLIMRRDVSSVRGR